MVAWLLVALQGSRVLFVSPQGRDDAPGTLSRPLRTLGRAVEEVSRERKAGFRGQISVEIRGGTYFLTEPLRLPASIGDTNHLTVFEAYKGEKPILSGGLRLTQWHRDGERYVTVVPGTADVNQLFLNGTRYERPRLPEAGYYHVADVVPDPEAAAKGDKSMIAPAGTFDPSWPNLGGVEVLIFHNWEISRLPVESVDPATNRVTFKGRTQSADWGRIHKGARFLIENVRWALHRPGQFFFDPQSRELTVYPLPGQDPTKVEAVAPVLPTVLRVEGSEGAPTRNVLLKGLSFAHSTWTMPPTGRTFPQAEADLGGAVFIQHARNVDFENCEIAHTGGYGLEVADDAQTVAFVDGRITDLGAGGVKIGLMTKKDDEATLTRHVTLKGNLIAGGGRVHPAGVGVWTGQSPDITVAENEIADFTYTGISLGWSWGYAATNTHDSRIVGNHIHDIGRGVLSDMGGIYHLGVDPGTVIGGNRIHDVQSFDYGGWGLYLDEGSTGVTMEDNIVYRCSRQSFHQHYGKDNVVRRNILAFAGESQLARTRVEDHLSFTLENNIVLWKGTPTLWGNWSGQVASDGNLFWRTDGEPVTFGKLSIAEWQKQGRDVHSLFVDPHFVDPEKDDFRIKPGSPALQLGFAAMDPKGAPWPSQWKLLPQAFP